MTPGRFHSASDDLHTRVIVNATAGGGRAGARWPHIQQKLERQIGAFSFAFTEGPGHATELTRVALRGPYKRIIAVGGDGTLNEVVNGFFEDETPIRPDAVLTPISCGTGGDFRRSLDPSAAFPTLTPSRIRPVDVGRLTYTGDHGTRTTRHFINIASFGMGGAVDRAVQRVPMRSRIGGRAAYFLAIARTLIRYRNQPVVLQIDGDAKGPFTIRNVAVANGRHFGGGLPIAPDARPDDGQLDIVVLGDMSRTDLIRNARHFYAGSHLTLERTATFRGRTVEAIPLGDAPVLLDVDGEPLGRLPATFSIRPRALRIQY